MGIELMKNVVITVKLFCLDSGKIELFFYTKIGLQNESLVELFEGGGREGKCRYNLRNII